VFVIVAFVLLFLLPSPWNFVGFIGGLIAFVGEVLFWNRKVRTGRKTVGAQTLIGKEATVVSSCSPSGQVRIAGEIWAARCSAGADIGETVTVVGRDGLTLLVDPARVEDADLPSAGR
jgi:membrane protein implicated in regulation of membrane protease activity